MVSHDFNAVEDSQAIALAITGDQQACATLIARYKHMVHTVAFRVLRNGMDAEEATQDTFVKALRQLGTFQGGGKFSTWLYSIAYRTALTALRKRKTDTFSLDSLPLDLVEPQRESTFPDQDRKAALEHALATLPPEDAAIVTMYHLEEMSVEEIVTVTGLGASNVKVKLHRSRKRLHEALHRLLKDELWTLSANT
ncbi:MAG: sigma-70 family RNA polymerase sigma factor [Bacteroidetes bacterium]|nr:sigma-70 family RNA polymerase sigma factor [Bacteroidota bacterium]